MVPFGVVVHHELRDGASEVALAEWDHAIQALFFDRANEALRVGVAVWRPGHARPRSRLW